MDLERALRVSRVVLVNIQDRYGELNRIEGVLVEDLREPGHHLVVLGDHQAVSLELGQADLGLGDVFQGLSPEDEAVDLQEELGGGGALG